MKLAPVLVANELGSLLSGRHFTSLNVALNWLRQHVGGGGKVEREEMDEEGHCLSWEASLRISEAIQKYRENVKRLAISCRTSRHSPPIPIGGWHVLWGMLLVWFNLRNTNT